MRPRTVLAVVGSTLCVTGLLLLVSTGAVASTLGAQGGAHAAPGASDPAALAFWYQLTFMRLFGTLAIGFGAILVWCRFNLTSDQQASLLKVVGVALGVLALMTLGQQVAIWNAATGWLLAGTFALAAGLCSMTLFRPEASDPAL